MSTETNKTNEEFLATARKRFAQAQTEEKDLRASATECLAFVAGEQWDPNVKRARILAGRPAMTFNRCHTFVQQVANEARQNKPQIKYVPGDGGDKDTAEVYEGLARHIQYGSDAQVAYETAVEYSAGGGFGYFRFLTDYCDNESFDLDLKVVPVLDPFSVYGVLVPSLYGLKPLYAFVVEEMQKDVFLRLYPDSQVNSFEVGSEAHQQGWVTEDMVRVAEYWYVEETTKTIKKGDKTRTVSIPKVKFCKLNGLEVLPDSETDWPGSEIPVVPVLGKQIIVDGKPRLNSVVSHQLDAQRALNISKSRINETLMDSPIQPYVGVSGAFDGHEADWETLNTVRKPYLQYNGTSPLTGEVIPPPQRQVFEPPIRALSEHVAMETEEMKATTGIYDASLGNRSNESSGVAIMRRQQQGDITNLHFMDNLERAFKKGGEMMAEVLPVIYDSERAIQILGNDDAPKVVKINQEHKDETTGKNAHYKVSAEYNGKYNVIVTMGRSFSTKRQESFDMMNQLIQANPNVFSMIGDIYFQNSDFAGADQLAERFKMMLPPQVQQAMQGEQEIPPQVQAQMQGMQQQLQHMTAFAQEMHQQVQTQAAAKQIDADVRLKIAAMQEETKRTIALATLNSTEGLGMLEQELGHVHKVMDHNVKSAQVQQAGTHKLMDVAEGQAQREQQQGQFEDQQAQTDSHFGQQQALAQQQAEQQGASE